MNLPDIVRKLFNSSNLSSKEEADSSHLSLNSLSSRFRGSLIDPLKVPYLVEFLRTSVVEGAQSKEGLRDSILLYLETRTPRILHGLRADLLSLTIAGRALVGFEDCHSAFCFTSGSFQELFSAQGHENFKNPQRFLLQLVAVVSLYLSKLPARLAHAPSFGHLARIGQMVIDYSQDRATHSQTSIEKGLACIDALQGMFEVQKGKALPKLHKDDADMLCESAFIPPGEQGSLYTLYQLISELKAQIGLKVSRAPTLILDSDRALRKKVALQCIDDVFSRELFPLMEINHSGFGTYSGEEVKADATQ